MKVFVVILIAAGIVWYFGFAGPDPIFQDYSAESGYFLGHELCTDTSFVNPYKRGTEEYSGFEWSRNNPASSCIGNISFRTGCEKQRELTSVFQECARNNRQ